VDPDTSFAEYPPQGSSLERPTGMHRDRERIDGTVGFLAADLHMTAPLPSYPDANFM